jgi:prepilin-type N-terminal cleavage/methylation domain-containing protein
MRSYARQRCAARPHGFTIVEVLCVVGVLLVLIAVVMPRLTSARLQAQRVGTLSNMRQLGILHQSYADDHRGFVASIFSPVYRGPTDPPERVHLSPGSYIDGDWFANAHWAWWTIDSAFPRAALLAAGNPIRHRVRAPEPTSSDFAMTSCAYAAREYWDLSTQRGPSQWGTQQLASTTFPSEKGLLMQMTTYELPDFPAGHPACCYTHIKTGILWVDLSGSEERGTDLALGVPNPWHRLVQRAPNPWYHGVPVLETKGGMGGRDRTRTGAPAK